MPESGKKWLFPSIGAGWGWGRDSATKLHLLHPPPPAGATFLPPFLWCLSPEIPSFQLHCHMPTVGSLVLSGGLLMEATGCRASHGLLQPGGHVAAHTYVHLPGTGTEGSSLGDHLWPPTPLVQGDPTIHTGAQVGASLGPHEVPDVGHSLVGALPG